LFLFYKKKSLAKLEQMLPTKILSWNLEVLKLFLNLELIV